MHPEHLERQHASVRDESCGGLVDLVETEGAHPERRRDHVVRPERLEGNSLRERERTNGGPAQCSEVGAAAPRRAEIGREGPDVGARRTVDLAAVHRVASGIGHELLDREA